MKVKATQVTGAATSADGALRTPLARNAMCPCGSGRRFKSCCGKVEKAGPTTDAALADELGRALALQREGRLPEALAAYDGLLARHPDLGDAAHMLGVIHLESGNFGEALRHLRRAAELFQWALPAVRHNLGLAIAALLANRDVSNTQRLWEAYDRWLDAQRARRRAGRPRVSVVVPSFNHAEYVESALESVFRQTYPAAELVVIDDGSSDGSADRIRAALAHSPCPVRFIARRNRGAATTINEAVRLSSGEYVNVLNSDDRFAESRLETMIDAVARTGALWGFSRVSFIDQRGGEIATDALPRTRELSYVADDVGARDTVGIAFLSGNPAISSGALFFARSLFDRLGGFRDLRYNHDWDFCLRAAVVAEPLLVASAQYGYRLHEHNTILESATAAKAEANAMFIEFYHAALTLKSAPNPFAPVLAVWGTRFFAHALSAGHAALLTPAILRDLAQRGETLASEMRA